MDFRDAISSNQMVIQKEILLKASFQFSGILIQTEESSSHCVALLGSL